MFLENFDIFDNPLGSRQGRCLDPSVRLDRVRALPPESTYRYLFGVYLRSKTAIVFPLLDRVLFEETIATAYDECAVDMVGRASAEACVWGMLALIARTDEAKEVDSVPGVGVCVQELRRLLIMINGAVNLASLQATLLLVSSVDRPRKPAVWQT
jgi:hypothetical protein